MVGLSFSTWRERRFWGPGCILAILLVLGAALGLYAFLGPGGDLRRLRLRIFVDGAAPGHAFDEGSRLEQTDLEGLNLRGARFPRVTLSGANLKGAVLREALFLECDLTKCTLSGADLHKAKLIKSTLVGADLRGANLADASLEGSILRHVLLEECVLRGANLAGADLTGAVGLLRSTLRHARNWHRAVYDEQTAHAIATEFQRQGLTVPDFLSWEAWLHEQERLAVIQRQVHAEDRIEKN